MFANNTDSSKSSFFEKQKANDDDIKAKMQRIREIKERNSHYSPPDTPKSLEKLSEKIAEMRKIAAPQGCN